MGLFSIDKSHYEDLRNLCDKTEKALIEYDKLEDLDTTKQVKAGQKFISKARSAMDRGTLTGFKSQDYILQLIDLCSMCTVAVKLLNESPEEAHRRLAEIRAEEDAELQRNERAAKGDIWDSLDK